MTGRGVKHLGGGAGGVLPRHTFRTQSWKQTSVGVGTPALQTPWSVFSKISGDSARPHVSEHVAHSREEETTFKTPSAATADVASSLAMSFKRPLINGTCQDPPAGAFGVFRHLPAIRVQLHIRTPLKNLQPPGQPKTQTGNFQIRLPKRNNCGQRPIGLVLGAAANPETLAMTTQGLYGASKRQVTLTRRAA